MSSVTASSREEHLSPLAFMLDEKTQLPMLGDKQGIAREKIMKMGCFSRKDIKDNSKKKKYILRNQDYF